jgi:hypothetical protein
MSLSSMRIPHQHCPPSTQQALKLQRNARRHRAKTRWLLPFASLFLSLQASNVYAIPGTPHALVHGRSLDNARQESLIRTLISNSTRSAATSGTGPGQPVVAAATSSGPDEGIPTEPFCFVVDTDARQFMMDTGANRVIVNDPSMLKGFEPMQANIKGIGGKSNAIQGVGTYGLPLQFNCGTKYIVEFDDTEAVYVPTSPYNIVPPQMLARKLREKGAVPNWGGDDRTLEFTTVTPEDIFKRHTDADPETYTKRLTIPLDRAGLYTFWTNPGYQSFFAEASSHDPSWCAFPGHVIPDDEDIAPREPISDPNPREPIQPTIGDPDPEQTSEIPRELVPNVIPFGDEDFESIPTTAVETDFESSIADVNQTLEDPSVAITRRKQSRLSTWHEKFGHLSFSILKLMAKAGHIPRELANVDPPTCPGCAYGKAHRKPWRRKGVRNRRKIRTATAPGQVVSVDQLVSPTAGFVPTHRGRPSLTRYIGATVFVDHFSDFTYVHLMTALDAPATVEAKLAFERVLDSHGAVARHYHADNGLFDTAVFKASINKAGQTLSFCGVNAHHQNGKAENRIKDVTQGARTSLLHASHRWPQAINASLWPAAIKHYVNLRNALPTQYVPEQRHGRRVTSAQYHSSPVSRLSGTEVEANLEHFHPFGSPVYVLENSLQSHHSHNKWSDRSRVGIFLTHSPHHAASVPLVLNTQTGLVSPQFHSIYDDSFDTCKKDMKFESLWQRKAKLQTAADLKLGVGGSKGASSTSNKNISPTLSEALDDSPPAVPPPPRFVVPWDAEIPDQVDTENSAPDEQVNDQVEVPTVPLVVEPTIPELPSDPIYEQASSATTTRSGRRVTPNRFIYNEQHAHAAYTDTFTSPDLKDNDFPLLQPDIGEQIEPHPMAFVSEHVVAMASSRSDPDTMTFAEAMKAPDREEFVKAMTKELEDHISRGHWKVVPSKSIPRHKRAIPMVWAMKRKRDPLGEIVKWKARLCAGGHRSIENVDYWATYSPVVSWSTVRLMIVFAIVNNWHMESIDFVLAYPQAPIKTDIFLQPPKVPAGFCVPDLPSITDRFTKVYKLLKNLYGLKDAGKTWADHLRKGLLSRGWVQSQTDSCLYTKNGIILVLYVDDAILISPYKSKIDFEIKSLQKDYDLTDDGELKDYLGTRFTRHADGYVVLEQPRMIERILEMVGLNSDERTKMHDTPACSNNLLDKDPNGAPRTQGWNYRSVVGSLSYLHHMIRPDLTFSVQQCARFSNNPSKEHEEAVKRICRYLLRTKDKGLVLKPDASRGLECFVDADWAGSWQHRSSTDPLSAHSRTGYVIMYAGCPIVWASKMQSLVALSTTEAEYIALSSSLREVIHIINLVNELKGRGFNLHNATPTITCRTFEDNQSCLEIATNHRTRPRTKHLSVRLHHFRSHVVAKTITIQHISTKDQIADIFTKPLPRDQFGKLRTPLMGWHHLVARE